MRRSRRWYAYKGKASKGAVKDLGMSGEDWRVWLNKTFLEKYGREVTEDDKVDIDEIIPCSRWNLPDDNKYCWHYLNSQLLLASDNRSKSNKYTEESKAEMIKQILLS